MKFLITLFTFFLLASCASAPKPHEMKKAITNYKLPNESKANEAVIYVLRPDNMGSMVRFNIHIGLDDHEANEIGWTRGYQRLVFYLPEGEHRILSVAENTAEMDIKVKAGEKVFLRQNPHFGLLFARNSLHRIDELEGTYWYMKMKDGEQRRKRIENDKKVLSKLSLQIK